MNKKLFMRPLRSVAKAFVSLNIVHNIRHQWANLHRLGISDFARWHSILFDAWVRDKLNRRAYRIVNESELRASRKSDKVFIFGSGYSLNDISPSEWRHFEEHDTLGFSGFIYQKWVRVDYHLIRGWTETRIGSFKWRPSTIDFANVLNANPYFQNTILIMQGEYLAQFCNSLIGYRLLRLGRRIFRYTTNRAGGLPTSNFKQGVTHNIGTLCDAVNFAYCLGWKEIILVGVDLYDSRYFWLGPDETLGLDGSSGILIPGPRNIRGLAYDQMHNTARKGIVEIMAQWSDKFKAENVHISVYNPNSLMVEVMPVYQTNHQNG